MLRPVIMVDESRLDAVGLEFLEHGGAEMAVVDTHARSHGTVFHMVFDGCAGASVCGARMQLAEPHGGGTGFDLLFPMPEWPEGLESWRILRSPQFFLRLGQRASDGHVDKFRDVFRSLAFIQQRVDLLDMILDDLPYFIGYRLAA